MNFFGLFFQYYITLFCLPICIFGIFCDNFFKINDKFFNFYLKSSAIFFTIVLFFISSYIAKKSIRVNSLNFIESFYANIMHLDTSKISDTEIKQYSNNLIKNINIIEKGRFAFFGLTIPFGVMFFSIITILFVLQDISFLCLIHIITLIFVCILGIDKIKNTLTFSEFYFPLQKFLNSTTKGLKGIQYYEAYDFSIDRFEQIKKNNFKQNKRFLSKIIWKIFWILCLNFLINIVLFLIMHEFFSNEIFKFPENNSVLFFFSIFTFAIAELSFLDFKRKNKTELELLEKYTIKKEGSVKKNIQNSRLFIAFHNIEFQTSFEINNTKIFNSLSFSILPGEFVIITGEGMENAEYIFDLLLNYSVPQSGDVYLAGTNLKNLDIVELRKNIGIFKENFGLVCGSILDNLKISGAKIKSIMAQVENFNIDKSIIESQVLNDNGEIIVPQEILFKIQMIRLALQRPSIILFETPARFESNELQNLFKSYVKKLSRTKTIILSSKSLEFIIYASKVLYLTKSGDYYFDPHCILLKNKEYQKFLSKLNQVLF